MKSYTLSFGKIFLNETAPSLVYGYVNNVATVRPISSTAHATVPTLREPLGVFGGGQLGSRILEL